MKKEVNQRQKINTRNHKVEKISGPSHSGVIENDETRFTTLSNGVLGEEFASEPFPFSEEDNEFLEQMNLERTANFEP